MNENQKIVLKYLKQLNKSEYSLPYVGLMMVDYDDNSLGNHALNAAGDLTKKEEFEVLAEFAKWGLKDERN